MEFVIKILTVFGIGILELFAAIPTGFALGLNPTWVGVASTCGAIVGVVLIVLPGGKLRAWFLKIHAKKSENPEDRKKRLIYRIWSRYGVIGLGLLAPLITGVPLGVAIGIAFGAPSRNLVLWSSLGVVLWGLILTVGLALGITGFESLIKR